MAKSAESMTGGGGKNYALSPTLEEGMYPARLVGYVDLGMQNQRPYEGVQKPPAYKCRLTYELVDEFMLKEDGSEDETKPRWVHEEIAIYPLSSDRAKSTLRLKIFDPTNETKGTLQYCIGAPCQVDIVHRKNLKDLEHPYENVGTVAPPPRKVVLPELVNTPVIFDMDEPDMTVYNGFPDFIKKKILEATDLSESPLQALLGGGAPVKQNPQPVPEQQADAAAAMEDDDDDRPY